VSWSALIDWDGDWHITVGIADDALGQPRAVVDVGPVWCHTQGRDTGVGAYCALGYPGGSNPDLQIRLTVDQLSRLSDALIEALYYLETGVDPG
jgi:hypothetical protein